MPANGIARPERGRLDRLRRLDRFFVTIGNYLSHAWDARCRLDLEADLLDTRSS